MFTAYFMAWDTDVKVRTTADYDKRVAELKAQQAAGAAADSKPSRTKPAEEAVEEPATCDSTDVVLLTVLSSLCPAPLRPSAFAFHFLLIRRVDRRRVDCVNRRANTDAT